VDSPAQPGWKLLLLATLAWCAAWSADLVDAWRHAPFDRLGWCAMLAWLAAIGTARKAECGGGLSLALVIGAWVVSLVGIAGELNVAGHVALALAGAGCVRDRRVALVLVALAPGWMPAFGWLLRDAGAHLVLLLRMTCAVACAVLVVFNFRSR
jgi:hypothetical protein